MDKGEIFLADFPFGDIAVRKLRPVLLISGRVGIGSEVVAAYISSVVPPLPLSSDVLIDPSDQSYQSTKLKTRSALRLHKIATIHVSSLKRKLGTIGADLQKTVDARLRSVLKL
jgi:mRNA-degrading endonuclease toxin of MazEF toxin-antitoxin module